MGLVFSLDILCVYRKTDAPVGFHGLFQYVYPLELVSVESHFIFC